MISVIIPTHNEAGFIGQLVTHMLQHGGNNVAEVIVSDYKSTDETVMLATQAGAKVIRCAKKGRAAQMNFGATQATGSIFYFVHADTLPPLKITNTIMHAVKKGSDAGRCRTTFLSKHPLLKLNAFFTRFDMFACYGGDQTFFITKALFNTLNGFDEDKFIMEDYDITARTKALGRYIILPHYTAVSARKYVHNSWLQVQKANFKAVQLYKKGASSKTIIEAYKNMLQL